MQFDRRSSVWFGTVIVILTVLAVYSVVLYQIGLEPKTAQWWSDGFWTVFALAASWRCFQTARKIQNPDDAIAWKYFAAASFSWAVGIVIWDYFELVRGLATPFPSVADFGFQGLAIFFVIASLHYRSSKPSFQITVKHGLNISIVLVSVLIIAILVLNGSIRETTESPLYISIALAYPVTYGSASLFAISWLWMALYDETRRRAYALMVLGLLVHTGVNISYTASLLVHGYQTGLPLDVFWLIGFGFFYLGATDAELSNAAPHEVVLPNDTIESVANFAHPLEALFSGLAVISVLGTFFYHGHAFSESQLHTVLFTLGALLLVLLVGREAWIYFNQRRVQQFLLSNIDERKRVEETLRELTVKLENANQAKTEFMATMSHEFRTPLNAILGFSEMLRSQYFGPLGSQNYGEYANDIYVSGEHLLALINDMLDIAAIESGKRPLQKEIVKIGKILSECISHVKPMADEKGLNLFLEACDQNLSIYADRRSLVQVILNLLSNAIKYTEYNGTITVQVGRQGPKVQIKIHDTGIGIPADKISTITDPFVQSSSDPYHTKNGTGLGLSIVKTLVEAHKGTLVIESTVGVGTTVIVTFPSYESN